MALCEQCGSISVVLARREGLDGLVGLVSSKRPFVCRRCGWRARRDWTDKDLRALMDYGAGGAEPDPELAVLDGDHSTPRRRDRQRRSRKLEPVSHDRAHSGFDLAALDLANDSERPPSEGDGVGSAPRRNSTVRRRKARGRQKRSRGSRMVVAVAASAIVIFLVVMLGLTGSCIANGGRADWAGLAPSAARIARFRVSLTTAASVAWRP